MPNTKPFERCGVQLVMRTPAFCVAVSTNYFVSRHSGISAAIFVHPYLPHPDTSTADTKLNA